MSQIRAAVFMSAVSAALGGAGAFALTKMGLNCSLEEGAAFGATCTMVAKVCSSLFAKHLMKAGNKPVTTKSLQNLERLCKFQRWGITLLYPAVGLVAAAFFTALPYTRAIPLALCSWGPWVPILRSQLESEYGGDIFKSKR